MADLHYPGDSDAAPSFEEAVLTRPEYISALVHFYRGELHRSTSWRMRLDTTTNWAIISVMGLVTFSLGEQSHSHVGILVGMILVFTFMVIESRRYRFFDVWRARTRMLEENFIGPILRRDLQSPVERWGRLVAQDLLNPKFKVTWHQALRARLLRNYIPLFLLLLICWLLKISMNLPDSDEPIFVLLKERMQIGLLDWWVAPAAVASLYIYLIATALLARRAIQPEEAYFGESNYHKSLSGHDT